ncbi:unnamed protein product, partial [Hapterophycus canaliculatus]
ATFAVAIFSARLDVGDCFSSVVGCPFEILSCLGSSECSYCLDELQSMGLTVGNQDVEVCSELYFNICGAAMSVDCDTTNVELVELLTCVAEDAYGCDDFTTCADWTIDEDSSSDDESSSEEGGLEGATAAPFFNTTTAPAAPGISTPAPVQAFPTPTLPSPATPASAAPMAAPSSSARGGDSLAPTATPSGGSGGDPGSYVDTAYPSTAPTGFWSFMEDTTAPSASSFAPTSAADGLRGGIEGVHSGAPTAAPTTDFEGLNDRSGGANGGNSSATVSVFAVAIVAVLATASALVGIVSPIAAALAI